MKPIKKHLEEIPLDNLVIGKSQVRLSEVGKDIDELAENIKVIGLLHPIIVCPTEKEGKFEIILGQRRFLAHKALKMPTIMANVLEERIDATTAKILSFSENFIRKDLNRKDCIDVCTELYKKYGSMKDVATETGLPYHKVAEFVKYDRLRPELKELVDKNEINIKDALRAQDAASVTGEYNPEEAIILAKELARMSPPQKAQVVRERQENPDIPVLEIIEGAKTGKDTVEITVGLGKEQHRSLKQLAKAEGTTLEDAARTLIDEGLTAKGFSKEE